MSGFGEIKYIDLRTIWPHEALNFTPWLEGNIQKLGEVLGMDLEIVAREASVGDFSLDLLARDLGSGRSVIIENQFGATDHDHFGKLLTYAAGYDASTIIWIAETIREEHRSALEWLNNRTLPDTQFFAVTVQVFRIDDSRPAYQFKPVVYPNEWQKTKQQSSGSPSSARSEAYRRYFQILIDELRDKHHFTNARAGQPQSWYMFASGLTGIGYSMSFAQNNQARVELYIDQGDKQQNKQLFDWLHTQKESIEAQIGATLNWERLDDRRACRIAVYRPGSILDEEPVLEELRTWSVTYLLKFKQVLGPRLQQYKQLAIQGLHAS